MTKREKKLLYGLGGAIALWWIFREDESRVLSEEKRLELIKFLAVKYGIDPSVALAVFDVESGGRSGFVKKGERLLIRFEPHIFRRYSKRNTGKTLDVPLKRGGQAAEYRMLEQAIALDRKSALESISMGMSQIMGFNHKTIGYPTVEAMYAAFQQTNANHIRGFFQFLENYRKGRLIKAARNKDFIEFASVYNGCKKPCPKYAPKMEASYKKWSARV